MMRKPDRAMADLPDAGMEQYRAPLIAFFLRRVHIRAEAEDLTQEVFIRLIARDRGYAEGSARSYIFAVAANLARDHARRQWVRGPADSLPDDQSSAYPAVLTDDLTPERIMLGRERLQRIDTALTELNDVTREIFIAFRLERRRQADIAAEMGISISAVEKHVARALVYLTSALGRK